MNPNWSHLSFFCVAKRKSKSLDEESVVKSSGNAWMNEELIIIWAKRVFCAFFFNKQLLAWNSYECHMTDSVRRDFAKMNADSVIIPGGCTNCIQVSDVCWNKLFKARITEFYDQWLSEGVHQSTEGGNMKPLSRKKSWVCISHLVLTVQRKHYKIVSVLWFGPCK